MVANDCTIHYSGTTYQMASSAGRPVTLVGKPSKGKRPDTHPHGDHTHRQVERTLGPPLDRTFLTCAKPEISVLR